jgi:hypothetical protein
MDPVSALGAAAAGAQFFGAAAQSLVKTVSFVKDLQEVPQHLRQLLEDIKRDITALDRLFRPESTFLQCLSVEQYATLSISMVQARRAMEELSNILSRLVATDAISTVPHQKGKGKAVKKLWKAVLSVKDEQDIEKKMTRVQRLIADLLRDLQVVGIQGQALVK